MEFELDIIRTEKTRKNSLSLYNLKQYHAFYHHSRNNFDNSGISERKIDKGDLQIPNSSSKRKIFSHILPSKLILDKKDEEIRLDNVSTTMANQRRASDTYSPYGTRTFPSLRQRPPSTDSNLPMSRNSLKSSADRSNYRTTNGNFDDNPPVTPIDSCKNPQNFIKASLNSHQRISLTAPRHPPYLYQSQSQSKTKLV